MEEKLIETFLREKSVTKTGELLGESTSSVSQKIIRMRLAGINLPVVKGAGAAAGKYTPNRVAQLNAYIAQLEKDGQSQ